MARVPLATSWIPRVDPSLLAIDHSPQSLLYQSTAITIRSAQLPRNGSTPVAVLSFRSGYAKRSQLWEATLRLLEREVFGRPLLPDLVSVIAVTAHRGDVESPTPESDNGQPFFVIMEMMQTSLYDVLHVDGLRLSRADILFIATAVLDTLRTLHNSGQSFGSTLTSRKVMLGGTRHVKLRRFCSEWVRREAEAMVADSSGSTPWTSQYVMPSSDVDRSAWTTLQHAQRSDLYAFGMLLLEMCSGTKPNLEVYNSISLATQVDPRLACVIRATLAIDGNPKELSRDSAFSDEPELMCYCTRQLRECITDTNAVATDVERSSSCRFKSFLHVDRYYLALEARQVERQVAERMAQSVVALKRLAAVEEDLVEEQRNFEVVVKQLEQLRLDKAADEREIARLQHLMTQSRDDVQAKEDMITQLHAELEKARAECIELAQTQHTTELMLQQARAQRATVEDERQALLIEILRLKDEKRALVDEKQSIEHQLAETAAKIGSEKDAIIELDARYSQAIHRCEQEQKSKRAVERQLEALSRQLTTMEEERSRYCGALQITPTGHLDARSSRYLVLELKEKEVESLRTENQQLLEKLIETQRNLESSELKCNQLETVLCPRMQQEIDQLVQEMEGTTRTVSELTAERELLCNRLEEATAQTETLQSTIVALEGQICDLQKQIAEMDKARRLKQCLTPNCDAPRYLVKPSGYCVDCEERMHKERGKSRASMSSTSTSRGHSDRGHRRQRSLDTASAIVNNTRNIPIMDLLKRIEVARDFDDESRDESVLELLSILKQLGKLLKDSASLKEDLPECGVLRCVLSVMDQFLSSPPLVIECCKTLSITVFNHDRNRLILVAEGAVEMLLKMLRAFPQEVKVQEVGAVLITNLAHNCESNRQRILAAGGVDAVLDMMQTFPRDSGIQKRSCWALLTLAGSDLMCDKIASLGGVGAALAAMLNCPDNEEVQHYGCWALLNLVSGTNHLQDFARQEGVVEVVEAALAYFPEHNGIQEKCRDILELVHQREEMSS